MTVVNIFLLKSSCRFWSWGHAQIRRGGYGIVQLTRQVWWVEQAIKHVISHSFLHIFIKMHRDVPRMHHI